MYSAVTSRPDIAHIASVLSQFNTYHNGEHWQCAKWVLRYLTKSLEFMPNVSDDMIGYVIVYDDGVRRCLWTMDTPGLFIPQAVYEHISMKSHGEMILMGKTKEFGKKLSQCHSPPQIPHGLTQAQTWVCMVRGQWLPELWHDLGYIGADWGNDHVNWKSFMDCAFRLGGTVLLWESRKQRTVVALSSTEAQYMAFTHSTRLFFFRICSVNY
jgi:hypothetical protein